MSVDVFIHCGLFSIKFIGATFNWILFLELEMLKGCNLLHALFIAKNCTFEGLQFLIRKMHT